MENAGGERRIPALDGVRGVAILAVLIFHAFLITRPTATVPPISWIDRIVETGWAGVDLFFVLSGFLITGILLKAKSGARYFSTFYVRRALRIFPAYVAFLLFLMLIVGAFRDDPSLGALREKQWWYWTFSVNIGVVFAEHEAWGGFSTAHLWSLMVEEQFYLVWPLIVLVLSRRALPRICIAFIVVAPLFRLALNAGYVPSTEGSSPGATFLLPSRIDTLAWGGLLASIAASGRRATWLPAFVPAAVIAVGGVWLYYGRFSTADAGTQVIGYSAVAILCAGAVDEASRGGALVQRLMDQPLLRTFGKYSYALYIFHVYIMFEVIPRVDRPANDWTDLLVRIVLAILTIGISFAVAWISWRVIEEPALRLKRYFRYGSAEPRPNEALPDAAVAVVTE
jgi:peptidoglycan/LPS O-acetylase OafA/YrhL